MRHTLRHSPTNRQERCSGHPSARIARWLKAALRSINSLTLGVHTTCFCDRRKPSGRKSQRYRDRKPSVCMELVTEAAAKGEYMGRAPTTSPVTRIAGDGAWESAFLTPDDSDLQINLRITDPKCNLMRLFPMLYSLWRIQSP